MRCGCVVFPPGTLQNRTAPNGKAFLAGPSETPFWVIHVWGTPYEVRPQCVQYCLWCGGVGCEVWALATTLNLVVVLRRRFVFFPLVTQMGYAQGQLMQQEARGLVDRVWEYLESQVEEYLAGWPNWLAADVANFGLDVALDLTVQWTKNFTGDYFFQEMQGESGGAPSVPAAIFFLVALWPLLVFCCCCCQGSRTRLEPTTTRFCVFTSLAS